MDRKKKDPFLDLFASPPDETKQDTTAPVELMTEVNIHIILNKSFLVQF